MIEYDSNYKTGTLSNLWLMKASRFEELSLYLIVQRATLDLFPQAINLEEKEEHRDIFRKLSKQRFPIDNSYISWFLKGQIEQVGLSELHDKKTFLTFAKYAGAVCVVFKICSDLYRENNWKSLNNLLPKIEIEANDVALGAEHLCGYWEARLEYDKQNLDRLRKSTEALRAKKSDRMQPVLEAYYKDGKITDKMRLHTVARRLGEKLGENLHEVPSISSIKRYLREEGIF